MIGSLVAVLLLVGLTTGCESTEKERLEVIDLVNQTRTQRGLRPLTENVKLSMKADEWAQVLRDSCGLKHSKLSDGAPNEWIKLGENVGHGGNIGQVHTAYLNSPGHRANIVDPKFTSMGAAAVWGECRGQQWVFTVQVFMQS